jgi:hypothetical protein
MEERDLQIAYKETVEKVYILKETMHKKYGVEPNAVYLGRKRIDVLTAANRYLITVSQSDDLTLFGMKVKTVEENNHISVGIVEEMDA